MPGEVSGKRQALLSPKPTVLGQVDVELKQSTPNGWMGANNLRWAQVERTNSSWLLMWISRNEDAGDVLPQLEVGRFSLGSTQLSRDSCGRCCPFPLGAIVSWGFTFLIVMFRFLNI